MDKSKAVIGSVEDAIDAADKALRGLIADVEDPNMKAAYELMRAINPGWCRWLKEHGLGDSHRIVYATTAAVANLMTEVVANVTTTELQAKGAELIGDKIKRDLIENCAQIGSDKDIKLPGFRRHDA